MLSCDSSAGVLCVDRTDQSAHNLPRVPTMHTQITNEKQVHKMAGKVIEGNRLRRWHGWASGAVR
jgi:hypothetical protein